VGDWIYYVNYSRAFGLYAIRTDGTGRRKLDDVRDGGFMNIQVVGDRIYYTSNVGGLHSMRTDGSDKRELSDDDPWDLNIVGDWIYYRHTRDDHKIYAIRTDGTERRQIGDDRARNVIVDNDWIYYTDIDDDFKLYAIRTDGTERRLVRDATTVFLI
jgi:hypothetical protein